MVTLIERVLDPYQYERGKRKKKEQENYFLPSNSQIRLLIRGHKRGYIDLNDYKNIYSDKSSLLRSIKKLEDNGYVRREDHKGHVRYVLLLKTTKLLTIL